MGLWKKLCCNSCFIEAALLLPFTKILLRIYLFSIPAELAVPFSTCQYSTAKDWLRPSRQSIWWNIAHKQCHTRFNSCPRGSHNNSFFANSAAFLIKFWVKFYHHLISKSPKVTALSFIFQPRRAVDLDKTKLVWLLMERELSLVWHCTCMRFRKIDCQQVYFSLRMRAFFGKATAGFQMVNVK